MTALGNGLFAARHAEDALSVEEAELAMMRRLGAAEEHILTAQGNLAGTYQDLGRSEEALRLRRDVYSRRLEFSGEEYVHTISAAYNLATTLDALKRYGEAKTVLRKMMPVARRVLGENNELTLRARQVYAQLLCRCEGATLEDLREAVTTLEETERIARRVLGGAHPITGGLERDLRKARAALRACQGAASGDVSSICKKVGAMKMRDG